MARIAAPWLAADAAAVPSARRAKPGACLFCRIASGDAHAHRVFEDPLSIAFLDHRPLFRGHVLLAPRDHYETLLDLPPERIGPLFERAQTLARALERGLGAEGSFVAINNRVSQSVPHLHVHVVPRRRGDGLRGFFWPRTQYADAADADGVAATLRAALEAPPSPQA